MGILLIFLALANTLALYILGKSPHYFLTVPATVTANQVSALIGATLLSISFILTTRFKLLEKLFGGLDKVYRIHHITGAIAFICIINHPMFLMLGVIPNAKLALMYIIPSIGNIPYLFGIAAFWIFISLISLTLFIKLPYHIWKRTHEYLGVVVLLTFLHAYTISSDISVYMPLRMWMLALLFLAALSYLYIRFLYRYFGPHSSGTIELVERQGDIIHILISMDRPFTFRPGQFVFLSVENNKIGREHHPFSISSGVSESQLRLSVKIDGDYTLGLRELKKGNRVTVHGPHGQFAERFHFAPISIFIGGGIGITPIVSVMRSLSQSDTSYRKVFCYYSVSSPKEAVFDDELRTAALLNPSVHYTLNITKQDGRLTAEKIRTETGFDSKNVMIFLCGPQPMMLALAEQFMQLGVRKSKISYEDFALR